VGKTVELRTEVPGPKSRAILERKREVVANFKDIHMPVVIDHAHGCVITDVDGNTFLDWSGGIGCLNLGHTNAAVSAALHEQIDKFLHTDFTIVPYEAYVNLAERLLEVTPISGPKKAAFFNSGAEAVENAVKVAKLATGRQAVIAFEGAFHGRTLMAMSLTSKPHPYKAGMGPYAPEVYRAPFPNPYRWKGPDPARVALTELRRMFVTHVAAENVAAIIVEPVQGEGGFVVPADGFLAGVREICDEYGIVMIVDEVQTGFGRTGKFFAIEHSGVEPDLITVAKSIAAGVPMSGVLGKRELMDAPHDSAIGGTYVGSPLGCVAGIAVLDEIRDRDLLTRGTAIGERIRGRFEELQRAHPQVGDVRGLGPMLALEFVSDPETKEPAADIATRVFELSAERGLILLKAGLDGNCIRVLVSLVATDEQIDEALDIISEAVSLACGAPALATAGD
jgi:4-aminobutyrate aminotransferase / (S)-3-amino-2-methylpropionate transaminase / 5-aminovalerate transaminase